MKGISKPVKALYAAAILWSIVSLGSYFQSGVGPAVVALLLQFATLQISMVLYACLYAPSCYLLLLEAGTTTAAPTPNFLRPF